MRKIILLSLILDKIFLKVHISDMNSSLRKNKQDLMISFSFQRLDAREMRQDFGFAFTGSFDFNNIVSRSIVK